MKKLLTFYRIAKNELDKVIFPLKGQIISASISVILVVTIITVFVSIVDAILWYIIK